MRVFGRLAHETPATRTSPPQLLDLRSRPQIGRNAAATDRAAARLFRMLRRITVRSEASAIPASYAARMARQGGGPEVRPWEVYTRAELMAGGARSRDITAAVRSGRLIRARENVYLSPDADDDCVEACRIGGRLACVSELARWGVFVLDVSVLHVDVPATSSRLRPGMRQTRVHWSKRRPTGWASVDIVEALVEATRCQPVRAAIATLDSALHLGLIDEVGLGEVFAELPQRLQFIRGLLDERAEAGSETLMRLLLRTLGCSVELQVRIAGVGRVDLLVDGWLIVECDSRTHHGSWEQRRVDLRRDQAAAALGMPTYRPIAEDIFWHPERVAAAVRGLLALRAAR